MLIRSAKVEDREAICLLWKDCFSDPDEYIDFYMTKRFRADFCAVLEVNREVVGMIHLLPCVINPNQKALYWYAAGIRSDYRNKGLFRKFSMLVKNKANDLGYRNLCVPAQGLEPFYKSIGFTSEYISDDKIFERSDVEENQYNFLFEKAFAADFLMQSGSVFGDLIWDFDAVKYAIEENIYCDGKVLKFQFEDKTYVFFAICKDDGILIDCHNMSEEIFIRAKNSIFDLLKTDRLIFRTQGNQKIVGLSDSNFIGKGAKITMTLA